MTLALADPTRALAESRPTWFLVLVMAGFGALTAYLRFFELGRSYDIFVDEVSYLRIGQSLLAGQGVSLYGNPFFLHPPFFFILEAAFLKAMPLHTGQLIPQILYLREFNASFAVLCAVVLFYVGHQIQGRAGGLIAAGLFVFDPFATLINSEVLLETTTLLWSLIGLALLVGPLSGRASIAPGSRLPPLSGERRRGWRARLTPSRGVVASISVGRSRPMLAGVAFGASLVTDDFAFFVSLLPVAVCWVCGWGLPRRQLATIAVVSLAVYGVYLGATWHEGLLGLLLHEKSVGFLRLIGKIQATGFNRPGAPSVLAAAAADLPRLGASYALMGLGLLAIGGLLAWPSRQAWAQDRLLGIWCAGGSALIVFVVLFHGTVEEQMFYYLLIPSVIAIAATAPRAARYLARRSGPKLACVPLAVVLVLMTAGGAAWYQVHTTPDDGYQRTTQWLAMNVAKGTTLSVTDEISQFMFLDYNTGRWVTVPELIQHHVRYVVISSKEVDAGYAFATPQFSEWVADHGHLVYQFVGPSYGRLAVYSLSPPY